jgi:hypothetical protein
MRLEWETRDTANNRLWDNTITSGAKAVTAAMLAAHPTGGAETMTPSASRQDGRFWTAADTGATPYFPDARQPLERPTLPQKSLYQNPWLDGTNVDSGDVARELRNVVKEENRFRGEDTSARITQRTFEHQWIPPTVTKQIVSAQMDAAERLRTGQDDWRQTFRR